MGFFLTKLGAVGATCSKGKKVQGKHHELPVPVITKVTASPLCRQRDTVHACHSTHRCQRTTLGICAHLSLCLIQGLLFTAAYTRLGFPVPASYRHARSTLPRFKWVWGIRTRVLRLCGTLPRFASFLRHSLCIVQAVLRLPILLPQPPESWGHGSMLPYPDHTELLDRNPKRTSD